MSDITCPYCGEDQEIIHDDGQGYEEDVQHEQSCSGCDKSFLFTTSISYTYSPLCQDGDHEMQPFGDRWPGMYECKNCEFYESRREEMRNNQPNI